MFLCYYCSINLQKQSEPSGLGPVTSSLVVFDSEALEVAQLDKKLPFDHLVELCMELFESFLTKAFWFSHFGFPKYIVSYTIVNLAEKGWGLIQKNID